MKFALKLIKDDGTEEEHIMKTMYDENAVKDLKAIHGIDATETAYNLIAENFIVEVSEILRSLLGLSNEPRPCPSCGKTALILNEGIFGFHPECIVKHLVTKYPDRFLNPESLGDNNG